MKTTAIAVLFILGCLTGFAQGTNGKTAELSNNPTACEIAHVFIQTAHGECDPFLVIPVIAKRGDKILPALNDVLFSDPGDSLWQVKADSTESTVDSLVQDTMGYRYGVSYAEMALEAIGTDKAYDILFDAATRHSDLNVRGRALDVFARIYYQKVLDEKLVPDIKIAQLLALDADDTTHIGYMEKSIAYIAFEGVKNWLGLDWGDAQAPPLATYVAAADTSALGPAGRQGNESVAKSHTQWWEDNKTLLKWNKDTGHFEPKD